MATQILTATETFTALELERLRIHTFRAPSVEEMYVDLDLIETMHLNETEIRDILDVNKTSFIQDGDYTFVVQTFNNIETLISTVTRHNNTESITGIKTGLVDSDLSKLQITLVYPTASIEDVIQVHMALTVKATKLAFYS